MGMTTRVAALAVVLLAAASGGRAAEEAVSLRYVFRTGEVWREKATLSIEMLSPTGEVLSRREASWTDRVEVASVSTQGSALLRRTPANDRAAREPVEVTVSDRGAYALSHGPAGEAEGMFASAVASRAPVLPEGPLATGAERTREMTLRWAEAELVVAETATVARFEKVDGMERAVVKLRRTGRPAAEALSVAALAASPRGALIAGTWETTISVDVSGSSGAGELEFDVAAGRLISYRMEETLGLAVRFGPTALQRTGRITFTLRRLPERE